MNKYVIALYIRLSIEDTKVESLSIQNQKLALNQFAESLPEAENAEILEFVDNGYSGTNFERPAVQELLELVQTSKINCIIVRDFSRFGRNSIEMGYFIEQVFPLFRTRFISVNDNFDTINYKEDTGGMEVAFKYLINEYYSRDLSQKSKSAKYMKMKNGEYQSKICPYGYRKGVNNRLEVDDEAANVVRIIFDMAYKGHPMRDIIKELYDNKIPTPGEYKVRNKTAAYHVSNCYNIWQRSAVLRILDDERYTGTYVIGKRTVKELGGKRVRLKDESEWIKIPNHHPAIIDKSVFEYVKANAKRFNINKTTTDYPLKSKVFCGCCNHSMQKFRNSSVLRCNFTKIDNTADCHRLSIRESELEKLLFNIISKQAEIILNTANLTNIGTLEIEIEKKIEYEKKIQACQKEKRNLYEKYLLKEISLDDYKQRKSEWDTELNQLNQIYSTLSASTTRLKADNETNQKMFDIAKDISGESDLTKTLTDTLIDKVFVFPDNNIEILWNIKDFSSF